MGHSRTRNRGLKVPCARLPPSEASLGFARPERSGGGLVGGGRKDGVTKVQTRRTTLDHHHQGIVLREKPADSCPEAELIALARSKGQVLTEHTLRLIREALELRGVTLAEFVADVRRHFRNNILNPSGFLINRARHFHQLSRAAVGSVPPTSVQSAAIKACELCEGQKYVIKESHIQPCPRCSTPESRRDWEIKEAERARRMKAAEAQR
jgi:hypothetical protein